jgi:lysophospholipase L1-like esterase
VVFSNVHGTLPMAIGAAHVAVRDRAAVVKSGGQPLTFGGRPMVTIPAGAVIVSDPVNLTVAPMADLAIDTFLPGDTAAWSSPLTVHRGSYTTSYVSSAGNHAGVADLPVASTLNMWWLLARVEVTAAAPARTIVMFGDSITDGTGSTLDANGRWPDVLARRLQAAPATASLSIANLAIAGNRVLSEASPNFGINALARFDRDVLAQPNAAYVVVLEGINDFGMGQPQTRPSAEEVIVGYQQLIARAHGHGLRIYGATLLPFEGAAYFSAEGEAKRQTVNQWIRDSQAFDGVIDFDKVTRDPASPTKLQAAYDSGDHLHPNDAGYKAMGESIDLALFR